jgi:dihydropteroate synthase
MGILNVTPDSFSDGGAYRSVEDAVARGLEMEAEGAAILDVGGESTRPGSMPVPVDEELRRVIPVIRRLAAKANAVISVDTTKAAVASAAVAAGARIVRPRRRSGDVGGGPRVGGGRGADAPAGIAGDDAGVAALRRAVS